MLSTVGRDRRLARSANDTMSLLSELKRRARHLKAETLALYLAARHPRTPWYARLFLVAVAAYVFSPIDLIPDFIPVLGYLDELLLLPLAIAAAIRMVPPDVLAECRGRAASLLDDARRAGRIAAAVVLVVWLGVLILAWLALRQVFGGAGQ